MKDIEHIIGHLNVPEKVKEDAIAVYKLIADAESHAHGRPVEEVHFHEVGAMDAVADIVGVCLAIYKLAPEQIIASPVHVGYGQIHCAHGILPIPAPATAHILQGIPIYGGRIEGELCTPTGAALLKHFAQSFGQMPMMAVEQTGYGMGMKDFTDANCLRAIIGNTVEGQEQTGCHGAVQEMDSIIELCCNLDDMTPEKIGFVTELLMEEGAFDVYTTNIQMKKNRPAVMLTCMCAKEDREKFLTLILKHTTTLGVREYTCKRYGLKREIREVETIYGTVRVKAASGYGVAKEKPEYEDMARIAKEKKISLAEIEKEVQAEYEERLYAIEFDYAVNIALLQIGVVDLDLVKVKLDLTKLSMNEKGEISGLEEQVEEIRQQFPMLFVDNADLLPANFYGLKPLVGQKNYSAITREDINNMNYKERLALLKSNPSLYHALIG